MFWIGVLPALLVIFIMRGVNESPVWLERQRQLDARRAARPLSLARLFRRDLIWIDAAHLAADGRVHLHVSLDHVLVSDAAHVRCICSRCRFSLLLNVGGVTGAIASAGSSERSLGRRGAATVVMVIGIAAVPLYVFTTNATLMWIGALAMGFFGGGDWGMVPELPDRAVSHRRARGRRRASRITSAQRLGSFTPTVVGLLQDRGMALSSAMAACIALAGILVIAVIWLGPETRGRRAHG